MSPLVKYFFLAVWLVWLLALHAYIGRPAGSFSYFLALLLAAASIPLIFNKFGLFIYAVLIFLFMFINSSLLFRRGPESPPLKQSAFLIFLSLLLLTANMFLVVWGLKSQPEGMASIEKYLLRSNKKEVILGTDPSCDLVLYNRAADRKHLKIIRGQEGFYVENLSRRRRVDFDGLDLNKAVLKPGIRVQLQGFDLIFRKFSTGFPFVQKAEVIAGGHPLILGFLLNRRIAVKTSPEAEKISFNPFSFTLTLPGSSFRRIAYIYHESPKNLYLVEILLWLSLVVVLVVGVLKGDISPGLLILYVLCHLYLFALIPFYVLLLLLLFLLLATLLRPSALKTAALFLLAALVFLPKAFAGRSAFFLSKASFADPTSIVKVERNGVLVPLEENRRWGEYGKTHNLILGYTRYRLRVTLSTIELFPSGEFLKYGKAPLTIVPHGFYLEKGKNYLVLSYPDDFDPVKIDPERASKVAIKGRAGELVLSFGMPPLLSNYLRIFLAFILFLIAIAATGIYTGSLNHVSFAVVNAALVMVGLGVNLAAASALLNQKLQVYFLQLVKRGLPLFLFTMLLIAANRPLLKFTYALAEVFSYRRSAFLLFSSGFFLFAAGLLVSPWVSAAGLLLLSAFFWFFRREFFSSYLHKEVEPDLYDILNATVAEISEEGTGPLARAKRWLLDRGVNSILAVDILFLLTLLFILFQIFVGSEAGISVQSLNFQPFELGKILLAVYLADWAYRVEKGMKLSFATVYLLIYIPLGMLALFLKDLSPVLLFSFLVALHFLLTPKWKFKIKLIALATLFVAAAGIVWAASAYLLPLHKVNQRIVAFLNPWHHTRSSEQFLRSLWLMKNAGFAGKFPENLLKAHLVPKVHSDMVTSLFISTYGLAGFLLLVLSALSFGFIAVAYCLRQGRGWERYVVVFATALFLIQFFFPVLSCLGWLPVMGQPVPFIAYANSNLVFFAGGYVFLLVLILENRRRWSR